jgi:dTMP kinase
MPDSPSAKTTRQTGKRARPGLFIVFEGVEACGKTTQIELLANRLRKEGCEPLCLREPGGTEIGEKIRAILKDSAYQGIMTPKTELLLMNAARAQLVSQTIRPALARGRTVICDRYFYSTLAYQGAGRELPIEPLKAITEFAIDGLHPDLLFLLDIPLKESWERLCRRNEELLQARGIKVKDRFEESGRLFHENVYKGYQAILEAFPDFRRLDGMKPREELAEEIWNIVQAFK